MSASPPQGAGVRARARGMIQKAAGEWPCKLSSVSANVLKDGLEGLEMQQRKSNEYVYAGKAGPSPTSVEDVATWGLMPSGLCLDSVAAALQGSTYLSQNAEGLNDKTMCNSATQRYGGGIFASVRGAHNTWQTHSECDASNQRQRHALSMSLTKTRASAEAEGPTAEGKEANATKTSSGTDVSVGNESLMCLLMRGLNDEKNTSSTLANMTRTPPSGYTGVRASAFALVSSNAVSSGRPAPERHCEAPPRVPIHQPSTKEGVKGMAKASTLTGRRAESVATSRKATSAGRSMEW